MRLPIQRLAATLARAVDDTADLYDGTWSQDYINEWEDGARAALRWFNEPQ